MVNNKVNEGADRLVVVATFLEPNQAHLARLRLEAEGIWAALDGEHHIAMDWLISNAIGGVKLIVQERDLDAASRILESSARGSLDEYTAEFPETDSASQLCPICNSPDVHRERLKRRLVFLSLMLLGVPLPFISRKSKCENCGHRWRCR